MFFDYLEFLKCAEGKISVPKFTEHESEAKDWVSEGMSVMAALSLIHGGSKIISYSFFKSYCEDMSTHTGDLINDIKKGCVFIERVPRVEEYKIAVFNNMVDCSYSRPSLTKPEGPYNRYKKIVSIPDRVKDMALESFSVFGLSRGVVSIIYNPFRDRDYVLDINPYYKPSTAKPTSWENITHKKNEITEIDWG